MKDPLVLVPGIDGTGWLFYRQLPLLERRYAVTTTRLRDDARGMDELVADLHRSVEAAAAGPVTLLGESFGGARATPWGMMRLVRQLNGSCLIAPDIDLSVILDNWTAE